MTTTSCARLWVEFDREDDGRWIADVPDLPGVMVYAATQQDALEHVAWLAQEVLDDRLTHHEPPLGSLSGNAR